MAIATGKTLFVSAALAATLALAGCETAPYGNGGGYSRPSQPAYGYDSRGPARCGNCGVVKEVQQVYVERKSNGTLGAVIGATAAGGIGHDLAKVNGPLLAPGLGAQGGRPADLTDLFGPALPLVLPAYSREILQNGPAVDALRASADTVWRSCASVLGRSA